MHTIAVLAVDGVIAFDLATPLEVFGRSGGGEPLYDVVVAGPRRHAGAGPISVTVPHSLARIAEADTVIIPGRAEGSGPLDPRTAAAIRAAAGNGARIASICVGALDLASTGLLDGLTATTHWRAADLLATQYPAVNVTPAALFVDNGQILTSAGASAGIDLCLHMIARDHGGAVAADAARAAVMPLTRDAGQAQYVRDDTLGANGLGDTLRWIDEHASEAITVVDIARSAAVSTRTLNRRFAAELGLTPSQWLTRARVRRAQRLLETTDYSVDRVAADSGLGTAANLRARFADIVGTSPTRYRTALTAH
ncbi:helix-turn-helix domain-containing protein [Arthrobacter sp. zg-Y877]|uniref:GlxA family transcriptional regulator n=1 Tax=Arthrobacter sp. zg-Y877 TaxID=3049074 RepID=UPI0025A455A0|nr:helix-turn-helix domain-containing protein [Arthrobacter sp. zg-Y877]MDM7991577.1 helix-turn-helix domain-containing protein [Arthrobacter sp. zg-Y877]